MIVLGVIFGPMDIQVSCYCTVPTLSAVFFSKTIDYNSSVMCVLQE